MESADEKKSFISGTRSPINTIIIGASAAGLAIAACLSRRNIPYLILEKDERVAGSWRAHYDRLHLNTEKWSSHLPYLPFPESAKLYLSRDEFVSYMETYAERFSINPLFNHKVERVSRKDGRWIVKSGDKQFLAENVIVATGNNRRPVVPSWPGLQTYLGEVFHSSAYKNGHSYKGKQVLVVGFGSSACEIAICLHEYGAFPSMSVKGAVNVVPRSTSSPAVSRLVHKLAFLSHQFPELVDKLVDPKLKKRYAFLKDFGLEQLPYGPNVQIVRHKKVPVLDIGTMSLIRQGVIKIYPGISAFNKSGVQFSDGRVAQFDSVILATGFHPDLSDFLVDYKSVTDHTGRPVTSGRESALPGLYFCGFTVSPYGMLHQIGREARQIAALIGRGKN
jgi:indole-3-pyruvate monooxygenase